ncbi:winged helix-turn-helix domain-containing protein [Pseudoroseomonas cervicalis]|uniref:winged helix-turn-helix domain-containing protein n=1 Tax=Teichococcus cervicalis TaxID=204525 RepID=UPI00278797C1|nr:LysR family transcriptional regulator [Pseudoroseomonas cervicalis]MDQ1081774.1 molybdate transport system regulatory protein [Pseudoroseomonas cervicalis]
MARARDQDAAAAPRLSLRIELPSGARIGPGKVRLLEEIRDRGSISAAGRALRMSYRRAWELADELSRQLGRPVVEAAPGGAGGGGARLTPLGEAVIARYRAVEREAEQAAAPHLAALCRALEEAPGG